MVQALIAALSSGLALWSHKEKTRYADRLMDLKRSWYEETNRADSDRNDAAIDAIELELRLLAFGFAATSGEQNTPSSP